MALEISEKMRSQIKKDLTETLAEIIASSNFDYIITANEDVIINSDKTQSFVFIEKFRQGVFGTFEFRNIKTTTVQIVFTKFPDPEDPAAPGQTIREQIESEIILPFIANFKESSLFVPLNEFYFFNVDGRFVEDDISIILQFNCTEGIDLDRMRDVDMASEMTEFTKQ